MARYTLLERVAIALRDARDRHAREARDPDRDATDRDESRKLARHYSRAAVKVAAVIHSNRR